MGVPHFAVGQHEHPRRFARGGGAQGDPVRRKVEIEEGNVHDAALYPDPGRKGTGSASAPPFDLVVMIPPWTDFCLMLYNIATGVPLFPNTVRRGRKRKRG